MSWALVTELSNRKKQARIRAGSLIEVVRIA
jgi:hypothetical protein